MNSRLYLKQIEVGPMENFVYLVGDTEKRQCVMIDPAWEVDRVLEIARKDEMKVTGGLITHAHFDHVNGVDELLQKAGGKVFIHKNEAGYLKGVQSELEKVDLGDKLKVGDIEIAFLHTPGHTPGSQCFLVQNRLVAGDTLFINACGRCDLPGGSAEEMYESLKRLSKLGNDVILLPGHNYAENPTSTIGGELKNNPYYQCASLKQFLALRLGR